MVEEEVRWYFIHTYSGQEERVKRNLEQRIATLDARD
ncbi:MAG: transcription termination/antitermination protein NusG, partial [Dehalococcoidia bacterium]|nr:transcription termination/antitermination protein NusG [Dehalococcoidia bacterium]